MAGQPLTVPPERPSPDVWARPEMAAALVSRDIPSLFRLLTKYGWSQRRIAAATGQSQSEISEIIGGRQVTSYPVLLRLCEGLGIPRGHMGLAYMTELPPAPPAAPRLSIGFDLDASDPLASLAALRGALAALERRLR